MPCFKHLTQFSMAAHKCRAYLIHVVGTIKQRQYSWQPGLSFRQFLGFGRWVTRSFLVVFVARGRNFFKRCVVVHVDGIFVHSAYKTMDQTKRNETMVNDVQLGRVVPGWKLLHVHAWFQRRIQFKNLFRTGTFPSLPGYVCAATQLHVVQHEKFIDAWGGGINVGV